MGGGRATPVRVARERNGISPTILFTCNVHRRHVVGVTLDLDEDTLRVSLELIEGYSVALRDE